MDLVQQLDNIDIVRLRDVAGLPTWVRDLTLVAFRPAADQEPVRDGGPSVFIVEETQDADAALFGRRRRIEFIPEQGERDDRFIRGLLHAADKIRSLL